MATSITLHLTGFVNTPPRDPQPSFPRKRESHGGLTKVRHYKAVLCGIPAYAGMTVGARPGLRRHKATPVWIPDCAGMTVGGWREGR